MQSQYCILFFFSLFLIQSEILLRIAVVLVYWFFSLALWALDRNLRAKVQERDYTLLKGFTIRHAVYMIITIIDNDAIYL